MWILTEHKEAEMMVIIIRMVIKWNSKELYRFLLLLNIRSFPNGDIVGSFC